MMSRKEPIRLEGSCVQRLVLGMAAFIVGILLAAVLVYSVPFFSSTRDTVLKASRSIFKGK